MEKQRPSGKKEKESVCDIQTEERQKSETATAFISLYDVVRALRGEEGCPWDRAQTHESLKPYLIEEAYETADAITLWKNGGGCGPLKEELGDLLFQVLLHSEIARQEGIFTLAEVAQGVRNKMIHRHPNVFPDAGGHRKKADWDVLKKEEKPDETPQEEMDRVPHCFPALLRTQKIQKKMEKYDGVEITQEEAVRNAQRLLEKNNISSEEGGELLYEICGILRRSGINAEQALKDKLEQKLDHRRKRENRAKE